MTIDPSIRAALSKAGATRRAAAEAHDGALRALEAARAVVAEAEGRVAKLTGDEEAWHERLGNRVAQWIAGGQRGPKPAATVDAKVTLELASARADLAAARAALPRFIGEEATATDEFRKAQAGVDDLKKAAMRAIKQEKLASYNAHISQAAAIRDELLATAFNAEFYGGTLAAGVLEAADVEHLNSPPVFENIQRFMTGLRHVVGIDEPLSGSRDGLDELLKPWRELDEQLEALANGDTVDTGAEAAA